MRKDTLGDYREVTYRESDYTDEITHGVVTPQERDTLRRMGVLLTDRGNLRYLKSARGCHGASTPRGVRRYA